MGQVNSKTKITTNKQCYSKMKALYFDFENSDNKSDQQGKQNLAKFYLLFFVKLHKTNFGIETNIFMIAKWKD